MLRYVNSSFDLYLFFSNLLKINLPVLVCWRVGVKVCVLWLALLLDISATDI
jgi:hypothetical protein